jgi:hypothetical protein
VTNRKLEPQGRMKDLNVYLTANTQMNVVKKNPEKLNENITSYLTSVSTCQSDDEIGPQKRGWLCAGTVTNFCNWKRKRKVSEKTGLA